GRRQRCSASALCAGLGGPLVGGCGGRLCGPVAGGSGRVGRLGRAGGQVLGLGPEPLGRVGGIVEPDLLDEPTVARRLRVRDDDAIEWTLLAAVTGEADLHHRRLPLLSGRGREAGPASSDPSRASSEPSWSGRTA